MRAIYSFFESHYVGGGRAFIVLWSCAFWMENVARSADPPTRRPNVVVILADDQGWGDLSIHGNKNLQTPRIDSLGHQGAVGEYFFVCPVCSPTRAEFLTGRYHPRGGVRDVTRGGERLNLGERTIAEVFRDAGYATGAFGKWHNGSQFPYHPNGRGFMEFYGFCSGHWGDYFSPPLEHNGRLVRGEGFIIDDLTNRAMAFMEAHADQPFFCYIPYNTPHSPMQVPDEYFERVRNRPLTHHFSGKPVEDLGMTRAALAMVENIDANVGRILDLLDRRRLADNTIVIYFSDNGPNSWRWNGGMRGRKGSTDDGGTRSPLLIRWPRGIKAGTRIKPIAGAIDLLPTLAELAAVPVLEKQPLDGRSLAPLLRGQKVAWPERTLFAHWNGKTSARTSGYRLDDMGRLYQMSNDPGQTTNIADREPKIAATLRRAVADWRREMNLEKQPPENRPFTVGYRAFPTTWLPARDGVPHGNIRRSAPAPNCSYFTNWLATTDSVTWEIEVAESGSYRVAILYTCATTDVGTSLSLEFRQSQLEAIITKPHDPPATGAERDRVNRGSESLVKDFANFELGSIGLEKGRGTLTLRAPRIPGQRAIDLRALSLTLMP